MIGTEPSLERVALLHARAMRERAEGLRESARTAQARLVAREESLARLRAQVDLLKRSLGSRPAPAKEAAPDSARVAAASLPRAGAAVAAAAAPDVATGSGRPRGRLRALAPYAAILLCAAGLERGRSVRPAPLSPELVRLARPAFVPAAGHATAKGAPVVGDDDRSQEALLLVHEWKLPGDLKTLGERLGGELDLPGGRPTWSVERTGERAYRVTHQAGADARPYSFDADLDARMVWPAPETQELLAPQLAALRD